MLTIETPQARVVRWPLPRVALFAGIVAQVAAVVVFAWMTGVILMAGTSP